MTTNRYTPLFWAAIICITAACSSLVLRAQHQLTITSDAPIRVEGDVEKELGFAPAPPALEIHPSCEADLIATRVLAERWDGGIEDNVRHNRNFQFRSTLELYARHCPAGQCQDFSFGDGLYAALNPWLLWYYQDAIAGARGGGVRCGVLRRQVAVGPRRNTFKCIMYCSTGVCAGVLRELRDLDFLDEFEEGRCPAAALGAVFDAAGRGESIEEAQPDPAFNFPLAITSAGGE